MARPKKPKPLRFRRRIHYMGPTLEMMEQRQKERLEIKVKTAPLVARAQRAMFDAYLNAGFKRSEALSLLKSDGHCC